MKFAKLYTTIIFALAFLLIKATADDPLSGGLASNYTVNWNSDENNPEVTITSTETSSIYTISFPSQSGAKYVGNSSRKFPQGSVSASVVALGAVRINNYGGNSTSEDAFMVFATFDKDTDSWKVSTMQSVFATGSASGYTFSSGSTGSTAFLKASRAQGPNAQVAYGVYDARIKEWKAGMSVRADDIFPNSNSYPITRATVGEGMVIAETHQSDPQGLDTRIQAFKYNLLTESWVVKDVGKYSLQTAIPSRPYATIANNGVIKYKDQFGVEKAIISNALGWDDPINYSDYKKNRIVALSTRAFSGNSANQNQTIVGIATNGQFDVLFQAVGIETGVPGYLVDPYMFYGATNDDWGNNQAIVDSWERNFATPLQANSKSSAEINTVNNGTSVIIGGANSTTGIVLANAYIDTPMNTNSDLLAISTRSYVGTGNNVMIAGFNINGAGPMKLIIRGVGPTIAAPPFYVQNTLQSMSLTLVRLDNNTILDIFSSTDNDKNLARTDLMDCASISVGLETLIKRDDAGSVATIIELLQPGRYAVILEGTGSSVGNALVEVYQID